MVCHAFRDSFATSGEVSSWTFFPGYFEFSCGWSNVNNQINAINQTIQNGRSLHHITSPGWRPAAEGQNSTGTSELDKFQMRLGIKDAGSQLLLKRWCVLFISSSQPQSHRKRRLRSGDGMHHPAGSCKVKESERSKGMFATCAASRGK